MLIRKEEVKRFKSKFESILFKARTKLDVISRFYTTYNVTKLFNIEYQNIVIIKDCLMVINEDLYVERVNRKLHLPNIPSTIIRNNAIFKKSQVSLSMLCYLYFYKFDIIFPVIDQDFPNYNLEKKDFRE